MAILDTDLLYKLSNPSLSSGHSGTQADPNASLGKYISTTQVSQIYDDISGAENAAGTIDYRCFFIHNNHGSLTLRGPVTWLASEVAGGANVAIGVDTTAQSTLTSGSVQALTVANETTAPSGVTFSSPTTKGAGLAVSDVPSARVKAIWLRRTATNSGAVSDGATPRVEGDTDP